VDFSFNQSIEHQALVNPPRFLAPGRGPWLQVLLEQQSLQPDVLSHHSLAVAMEVDEGTPVIPGEHQNRLYLLMFIPPKMYQNVAIANWTHLKIPRILTFLHFLRGM
jgi:hypothetical protein